MIGHRLTLPSHLPDVMHVTLSPGLSPPFFHTVCVKNWRRERPGNEASYWTFIVASFPGHLLKGLGTRLSSYVDQVTGVASRNFTPSKKSESHSIEHVTANCIPRK